jgi:hypothetical protein
MNLTLSGLKMSLVTQGRDAKIRAGVYPGFCSIERLGALLPLDGMLVHRRLHVPPQLLLVPM